MSYFLKAILALAFLMLVGIPLSGVGWFMVMWFIMQEGADKPSVIVSLIAMFGYASVIIFVNIYIVLKIIKLK